VPTRRLQIDPRGVTALDIGCGGGFLAEEFARLGCNVTGIDPSAPTLETACAHAHRSGLDIDYRVGVGEELPVDDAGFGLAYCCDVLEHVDDLDRVIAETSRALKPGGIYLFDTVNRTWLSKLVAIKLMQDWKPTRVFDSTLHDWNRFIKPKELGDGTHAPRPAPAGDRGALAGWESARHAEGLGRREAWHEDLR